MTIDKLTDGFCGKHHYTDGDNDCQHHDRHVFGHADGGNDRIQRKNDVDHRDLSEHCCIAAHRFRLVALLKLGTLHVFPDLLGAFVKQEQTAAKQDQVATGYFLRQHGKQWCGKTHDPGQ